MEQQFYIPGPMPSFNTMIEAAKKVGYIHQGRGKPKKRIPGITYVNIKAIWTDRVSTAALLGRLQPMEACFMDCIWIEKTKHRDPDNVRAAVKFIWDGLIKAKILKNDGWKQNLGERHRFMIDKRQCGVIVVLRDRLK